MEIGAYHGANTCSYMKSYARHPRSEIHCVDPWMDYDGYDEYQSKQHTNYSLFIQNLARLSPEDLHKVHLHRGLSETMIPRFADNMFDIIYIDGNHSLRYVLQDAIQSYHKIKRGGWIIFDDMQDKEVNQAVQMFLMSHSTDFDSIQIQNAQLFMRRRG
jgi:precorrin-6B methylase 2